MKFTNKEITASALHEISMAEAESSEGYTIVKWRVLISMTRGDDP